MIHLEAVYHRASQQFCYALNEEILMVGLLMHYRESCLRLSHSKRFTG